MGGLVRLFSVMMCMVGLATCGYPALDPLQLTPEGTHYGFVVNTASVPTSMKGAPDFGLDLGYTKSGTPDGTVDNRLGEVLGTLAGMGLKIQDTITTAVNEGGIILLVDFQTKDFTNASASGLSMKLGANPMPAPCTGTGTAKTCGLHLRGTGTFSVDPKSPTEALVSGKIVNGTFNGGPGELSLQIALTDATQPLTLSLLNARAKATVITADGMSLTVGGALSVDDVNMKFIPALTSGIAGLVVRDCGTTRALPTCGCPAGSTGATMLNLFDGDLTGTTADCNITKEEIAGNAIIHSLLSPDICSMKTCTAPDALSFGIKVTTVKATIN